MKPEPDQECLLCGTSSPCRKTDEGRARFYDCPNRECGPAEVSLPARKELDRTRTVLHMMLSREAEKARKANLVLRIRADPATKALSHVAVRRDEVQSEG